MARPRKQGRRTQSGRLKRDNYPAPSFDKGSEWVKAMRAKYGEDYCWALGRAYAYGLLGEGNEAKARYDAAKKFVRLHRLYFGGVGYRCGLDDSPRGGSAELWTGLAQQDDRKWLQTATDSMDVAGIRSYFDALISSLNVDSGPIWLDILLARGTDPRCYLALNAAIRALDIIAPETKPVRILSVAY